MRKEWADKKVLILGLGQFPQGSGIAAALFAVQLGATVRVTDMKTAAELAANVKRLKKYRSVSFVLGEHRLSDIDWADIIIRNPRVRPNSIEMLHATKLGKCIESDVSIFLARCQAPVIGITGTRGKSTTTTMVHEMLSKNTKRTAWLGGNILISPLTFVARVKPSDIVVLELSSWQLESTGLVGLSPQLACITNLMRDHLNSYQGMEDYGEAKAQIFRHQSPLDTVILNADDAFCREKASEAPSRVLLFSQKKSAKSSAWIGKEALYIRFNDKEEKLVERKKLKLFGVHNELNLLAAALVAMSAGARLADIRAVASSFAGLHDRQEILAKIEGVTFINDTTATTPDGTIAALRALAPRFRRLRMICGGNDKELDFSQFGKEAKRVKADIVLIPGNATDKLKRECEKHKVKYLEVPTLKEAVIIQFAKADAGDAVVLSPGATSFGQFKNEFDRGNVFRKIVTQLQKL